MNKITKTILINEINDIYENNIVWGSIDPINGDMLLYPVEISEKIEDHYINGERVLYLPEFHNIAVHFINTKFFQTTSSGYRCVFRENIEQKTQIEKEIYYNPRYKAYYLNQKFSHIGLVVDISSSMNNVYEKLIETAIHNFLLEQATIENNVLFYGITFADKTNTLYNGINLKTETEEELKEVFLNLTVGGCTAYYDSVIEMINLIDKNIDYKLEDEVVLCIVTDGLDNRSKYNLSQFTQFIKQKKQLGWHIIMMGTNDLDMEELSTQYGIEQQPSLNVGNTQTETENAFRSLSNGLNRVRTGDNPELQFTEIERSLSKNH